ncbi:PipA/GogA/GtgA family type III secretion system effector [Pararobbsia silviterrae]|uniref:PipA/GogA/GtgA family type III secretion system effector n=1 Tax=Pararobbsia silviterrae TaxID=1792498 RepID=A0A494XW68_9BURK|nr:PipA/GogA/GtgA family type III secretion system effector [Pararobbsia silviterrae]RKP54853.1 PipA/GogA/GtgA family type III secretion system effector [Pararobbsia silviterrae]
MFPAASVRDQRCQPYTLPHPPEGRRDYAIRHQEARLANDYPDLWAQTTDNPSSARLRHDLVATDDHPLQASDELVARMIVDAQIAWIDDANRSLCDVEAIDTLHDVITRAYERSATFRRLFNYATRDVDAPRWQLQTDGPLSIVLHGVSPEHDAAHGAITFNLDACRGDARDPARTYMTARGSEALPLPRAYLGVIVPALTRLPDDDCWHARGPNIEYVNLICKEMGHLELACMCREFSDMLHATATQSTRVDPMRPAVRNMNDSRAFEIASSRIVELGACPDEPPLARKRDRRLMLLSGGTPIVDLWPACAVNASPGAAPAPGDCPPSPGARLAPLPDAREPVLESAVPPDACADVAGSSAFDAWRPASTTQREALDLTTSISHPQDGEKAPVVPVVPVVLTSGVARTLDEWRTLVGPYAIPDDERRSTQAEWVRVTQRRTLCEFLIQPSLRDQLIVALSQGSRCAWPARSTRWWLEMLESNIEAGHIRPCHALAIVTEPCAGTYKGSFAAGLMSCADSYPDEVNLFIAVIKSILAQVKVRSDHSGVAASVRLDLLNSVGPPLLGGVGKHADTMRDFYDWVARSTPTKNPGIATQLKSLDLLPRADERASKHMRQRSVRTVSPYVRMTRVLNLEAASTSHVSPLATRAFHLVAQEVVAALSDRRLIDIDAGLAAQTSPVR